MDAAARIQLRIDTLTDSAATGILGGGGIVAGLRMALADLEQAPPLTQAPLAPDRRIAELQRENDHLVQRLAHETAFAGAVARERDQLRAQIIAEAERRRAAMLTAPAPIEPDPQFGQPHTPPAPPQPRAFLGVTSPAKTEARLEALRALWARPEISVRQIHTELAALPGGPMPKAHTCLYDWAKALGLPGDRSTAYDPAPAATPAAAPAAAVTEARFADLLPEDIAEAREMIAKGQGARALHEHFGWELAQAQALAATIREEAKAAA
jgi:hypothetical protein